MPEREHRIYIFTDTGEPLGLNLYRIDNKGPNVRGSYGPMAVTDKPSAEELPLVWNDFGGGMGCSTVERRGSYGWTLNGHCRTRAFMPGGLLVEVPLPAEAIGPTNEGGIISHAFVWEQHENPFSQDNASAVDDDLLILCGRYLLKVENMGEVTINGSDVTITPPTIIMDAGARRQLVHGLVYSNIPIITQYNLDQPDSWEPEDRGLIIYGPDQRWYESVYDPSSNFSYPENTTRIPMVGEFLAKVYWSKKGSVGGHRLFTNDSHYTYAYISTSQRDWIVDRSAWADLLPVGEPTSEITNLIASNWHLYIAKTDGIYDIQEQGQYTPNLTPPWRNTPHWTNGRAAMWHDGKLWASMIKGIDLVDAAAQARLDEPGLVHPGAPGFPANATPVHGQYTACTTDAGWAVWTVWNGIDSHVIYGKTRDKAGTRYEDSPPVIWHGSECTIRNQRVTMVKATARGQEGESALWIGTLDQQGVPHLYWLSTPRSGNPLQEYLTRPGRHLFTPEALLYLPLEDWRNPTALKVLRRFSINTWNLTENVLKHVDDEGNLQDIELKDVDLYPTDEVVEVEEVRGELDIYSNMDAGFKGFFDDASSVRQVYWKLQGTAYQSPKSAFVPAVSEAKGYQVGLMIKGRLAHATEPNFHPFVFQGIEASAQVIFELLPRKQYSVIVARDQSNLAGGRDTLDPHFVMSRLERLQTSGPFSYIDEFGRKHQAVMEPGYDFEEMFDREGQPWSFVITFRLIILSEPFYYDTEAIYDSTYTWS